MTLLELIDYSQLYWQYFGLKSLEIMKDYPCEYIDNKLGIHSLTYGTEDEFACALHVKPHDHNVYLFHNGYCFHYDHVEKDGNIYLYDEIDSKLMNRLVGIILFIANHEYNILEKMRKEAVIVNYLTIRAKK